MPLLLTFVCARAHSQLEPLKSSPGHDAERVAHGAGMPATVEGEAVFEAKLVRADAGRRGEVWLQATADTSGGAPSHVTLRIPVSSTEDVYGESRSCKVRADGSYDLTFTAGMDEKNFLRFTPDEKPQELLLPLNKYLCRALAAPFHCGGREIMLPQDWSQWRLASASSVLLTSDAPAELAVSPVRVRQSGKAFDSASCAAIAPSNGLCCVAGKTTEWHCGGTPAGLGWHQVSGECFHRETGGNCTGKTVFGPLELKPMQEVH